LASPGLPGKGRAVHSHRNERKETPMEDDDIIRKPKLHEVGMLLDTMSVDELTMRIELLEAEIIRLRAAIESRHKVRSAADSLFKL